MAVSVFVLLLVVLHIFTPYLTPVFAYEQISVASGNVTLRVLPSLVVEKSPGSKLGSIMLCERVLIHGFPRLKHLKKFPDSLKINVSHINPNGRQHNIEVCFHRNMTVGVGMCPQGQWEKLTKGSWAKSMSPYDHKILDIRMTSPNTELLQVSVDEEFFFYRVVFLVSGIILLTLATFLSKSLVFYYGGAMSIGILLVVLIILFQGMKLLPAGRKNSLALFFYSSMVGLGTFLLRDVPSMLRAVLIEIGLGEDMYPPVFIFLLLFLVIAGAWLGFWVVRKLILDEKGDVDNGVAQFVAWSIRILASAMILQSSLDPLLAIEALVGGILVSVFVGTSAPPKLIYWIYRTLRRLRKQLSRRKLHDSYSSPVQEPYKPKPFTRSPLTYRGSTSSKSPSQLSDREPFFSTFHETPERRKYSKEEWNKFTKETTKRALEGLVSSPDFGKWAIANADRLTLVPHKDVSPSDNNRRWWFNLS